jgi:hypothetical protein
MTPSVESSSTISIAQKKDLIMRLLSFYGGSILSFCVFTSFAMADCPSVTSQDKNGPSSEDSLASCVAEPSPDARRDRKSMQRNARSGPYWHGNGSIISLHGSKLSSGAGVDYPYGITKDVIQMHADSSPGAGFFQWQVSEGCNALKLISTGLSEAQVTLGTWKNRNADRTFDATLPFVLSHSNTDLELNAGSWYVIKVLFDAASDANFQLKAECTTESGNGSYTLGGSGTLDGGYDWSGTASVIAHMFRNLSDPGTTDWPYGVSKDVVMVSTSTENPMALFQWQYDSNICPRLTLDAPSLSGNDKSVDIVVKTWNAWHHATNGSFKESAVTLPTTVDSLSDSDGRWNLVQILFKNGVSKTSRITAECTSSSGNDIPTKFTMEWLSGRTLYWVWFGEGTDAQGNEILDVPVVEKMTFNGDGTAILTGLKNSQNNTGMYGVTSDGMLYSEGNTNEGNKIVCGSTSQYIKTHYTENGQFDNTDLLFFNEEDALSYANTLTRSIPRCTE